MAENMNEETIVMDMDLEFGTLGLDFNRDPAQTILDALTSPERVDDVLLERLLVKTGDRLSLFTAPAMLDQEFEIADEAYDHVLEVVRQAASTIVIDMPHVWTSWAKRFVMGADEIVITAVPDLASLRNTKNMFDLMVQARPNDPAPRILLNQTGIQKRPEIPLKEFADAISTDPEFVIPFDGNLFGDAANNGLMIGEMNAQSKPSAVIAELATALIGRERTAKKPKASSSPMGLFKSFMPKKKKQMEVEPMAHAEEAEKES
jgi:pilus assembly protein CpaE